MEEELKVTLRKAIDDLTDNLGAIKRLAFKNGGREAVDRINQRLEELRNAYFEILKSELDKNHDNYLLLIEKTNSEGVKLNESVKKLNDINDIINLLTSVINLSGQILTKLIV